VAKPRGVAACVAGVIGVGVAVATEAGEAVGVTVGATAVRLQVATIKTIKLKATRDAITKRKRFIVAKLLLYKTLSSHAVASDP
jgi:hypothetical protein